MKTQNIDLRQYTSYGKNKHAKTSARVDLQNVILFMARSHYLWRALQKFPKIDKYMKMRALLVALRQR